MELATRRMSEQRRRIAIQDDRRQGERRIRELDFEKVAEGHWRTLFEAQRQLVADGVADREGSAEFLAAGIVWHDREERDVEIRADLTRSGARLTQCAGSSAVPLEAVCCGRDRDSAIRCEK